MAGRTFDSMNPLQRRPEPRELMDDPDQARAYAEADFSDANRLFLELFDTLHPQPFQGEALDLGSGPAAIPILFARRHVGCRVDAVEGAPAMLDLAREAVASAGLGARLRLLHHCLPCSELPEARYQAVLSNSLLHHLADPLDLWRTVRRCAAPGAVVLVMDLMRPATMKEVETLVERHAADAPKVLRRDFRASLLAAYTPREVRAQLERIGLTGLEVTAVSDRHLAVRGRLA